MPALQRSQECSFAGRPCPSICTERIQALELELVVVCYVLRLEIDAGEQTSLFQSCVDGVEERSTVGLLRNSCRKLSKAIFTQSSKEGPPDSTQSDPGTNWCP
jgi:hypothetical protein